MNTVSFAGELHDVVFKDCEMRNCNFTGTRRIHDVVFENCNLENANFRKMKLERVYFIDCVLNQADFFQALMADCAIRGEKTTLRKTIFGCVYSLNCEMSNLDFSSANLHNAKGFESFLGNQKADKS